MAHVRRSLEQLINREEPAWPLVQGWIAEAKHPVEILLSADGGPIEQRHREAVPIAELFRLHVGAI